MKDKILSRISELSCKINELLEKRDQLTKELYDTNTDINVLYNSIYELKDLITTKKDEE